MTHDLHLQVKEGNIVGEHTTIPRNFVLFAFFIAKSSMYKRFNNAFGGSSINFAPTDKSGFRVYDYGAKRCRYRHRAIK